MAKFTDAVRATLTGYFNAGDQPTEAQFTALILAIQEGIEEHDHDGTGDGDGIHVLGNVLYIDRTNGRVSISLAAANYKFDVRAQVGSAIANFFNDGNADANYGIRTQCGLDANSAASHLAMYDGDATLIGAVKGDGAGGATLWSACDRRLKDIEGDLSAKDALAALKALTPKRYKGKRGGKTKCVGFVAQEVMAATEGVASYDEKADLHGLDYARLTAYLWAQNKALLERIEQLEAK